MHAIVPARVAVAEIGLAHESPVRHVDQAVRNGDADVGAFGFVAPLILAGPPGRRAFTFVRGIDPVLAGRIGPECQGAKPALFARLAGVVKLDRVGAAAAERLREIDVDRVVIALVLQRLRAHHDLLDGVVRKQLQLDARVVLEHLEADGVLAGDPLLLGIDPDVEVVVQQVVVGAVAAVLAAQDVRARRRAQRGRRRAGVAGCSVAKTGEESRKDSDASRWSRCWGALGAWVPAVGAKGAMVPWALPGRKCDLPDERTWVISHRDSRGAARSKRRASRCRELGIADDRHDEAVMNIGAFRGQDVRRSHDCVARPFAASIRHEHRHTPTRNDISRRAVVKNDV